MIRLLRPRQWVKNVFVLAPLLFSGLFTEQDTLLASLQALLFFCAASSFTYIINDLHDRERDRAHPVKYRKRPLASGAVTAPMALVLLGFLALVLALFSVAAPDVALIILGYLLLNLAYTFFLKNQPVLDIFAIAIGFVLRVQAGAVALQVEVSRWMFITTLCLALYLAAIKRRQELRHETSRKSRAVLKSYSVKLVEQYAMISASGALVFYSLYVVNEHPNLVITVPLVLFGLFRYWYLTQQGGRGESPTDTLLTDWPLLATLALWTGVWVWVYLTAA